MKISSEFMKVHINAIRMYVYAFYILDLEDFISVII